MSLFKTWEQHYINGTLPKEWPIWEDCRTWAINNRYKMEYGYKGEFSPEGCLKAMPGYVEPGNTEDVYDFDKLMRMKLDELKQLAINEGIKVGEAATKKEIANSIIERRRG